MVWLQLFHLPENKAADRQRSMQTQSNDQIAPKVALMKAGDLAFVLNSYLKRKINMKPSWHLTAILCGRCFGKKKKKKKLD